MDIKVLKKQIGDNILNSLDDLKEKNNLLILENGKRTAKITLNAMDLYDIILKGENQDQDIKENVYFENIRDILKDHFNFSLLQAKMNQDQDRLNEIDKKVKKGERVRIL